MSVRLSGVFWKYIAGVSNYFFPLSNTKIEGNPHQDQVICVYCKHCSYYTPLNMHEMRKDVRFFLSFFKITCYLFKKSRKQFTSSQKKVPTLDPGSCLGYWFLLNSFFFLKVNKHCNINAFHLIDILFYF